MKSSRIVFVILCYFHLISCQNGIEKKRDVEQDKNAVPSTEHQETEKSLPQLNRQRPIEKRLDKEEKKKKLKAIDTLKPITAAP